MKINYNKLSEFGQWAVIAMITKAINGTDKSREEKDKLQEKLFAHPLEITLTINGEEMDFNGFIERLEANLQWHYYQHAEKIVEEKWSKLFGVLDGIVSDYKKKILAEVKKLDPDYIPPEW